MNRDAVQKVMRGYYYLAPFWFALETMAVPDLRAGLFADTSLGVAGFYGVEAAIGAAFWFKLPLADKAALVENATYLVAAFKYILFGPIDMALSLDTTGDGKAFEAAAQAYTASMPGILMSCVQVVSQLYGDIYKKPVL